MAQVTNARVIQNRAVGVAIQNTQTGAATTPDDFIWCRQGKISPESNRVRPQGTHGSVFKLSNGITETHKLPMAELSVFGTPNAVSHFARNAMMGRPTSLAASSDFTEAGDTTGIISFVSFTGVAIGKNSVINSSGKPQVFVKVENTGSAFNVSVFKDSGLTSTVAFAAGLATGSTGNIIAQVNTSKLTAVADIGSGTVNSGITVAFSTLNMQFGKTPTEYMTLFDDDGVKLWKCHGGVVNRLEFQQAEGENLMLGVEMFFESWNDPTTGGLLTASGNISNLKPYQISELTALYDPTGTTSTLQLSNTVLAIQQEELVQFVGNRASPCLILDGYHALPIEVEGRFGDELFTVLEDSLAVTFTRMRFTWVESGRTMQMDYQDPELEPDIPGFDDGQVDLINLAGEGYFDQVGGVEPLVMKVGF